jgi:DNA-binding IclR family transcriptional regulator
VRVAERGWTFLTNHAHVLVAIARDPEARLRDVAAEVGITERAAQGIVHDLVAAGYVTRERVGRRNRYEVNAALPLRHPLEREHDVAVLLAPLGQARRPGRSTNPVATRL